MNVFNRSIRILLILTSILIFVVLYIHQRKPCNRSEDLPSTDFYPCIAVLVEFRTTDKIISVIDNVNLHIPLTWPIQIFHGEENEEFIRTSTLASLIGTGKIFLTLIKTVYQNNRIGELFTVAHFWEQIPGEKILLFQIDSIMCSNSPHRITDYLQYDYTGAPWNPAWYPLDKRYLVGNGGFSLRSRSKILALIAMVPYNSDQAEDVWYAQNLHRVNASVAPVDIAKTFAVESIYYERPVGVHRFPWRCDFRRKLSQTCPEAVMVLTNGGC